MAYMNDNIFDQGLDYADTNGTRIDITYTQEATTYTEATSTYTCGNKTGLNTGATADHSPDGRQVAVPAITDGSVTDTQTAGWWALTDGSSVLVAAGPLTATQAVTNGNTFSLDSILLAIRDATAV